MTHAPPTAHYYSRYNRGHEARVMWRMPGGDRVLNDAEWELFADGLDQLRDAVECDIECQSDDSRLDIAAFDDLTPEQKLVLLADVALALRDPAVPTPVHTAANEGAVAAVFAMIGVSLDVELDQAGDAAGEKPTRVRRALRAICSDWDEDEPLPDESCTDPEEWRPLVEDFETRVFWDVDYAMRDQFLDLPPEEAEEKLRSMGIPADYYLAVPDEPIKARLTAARQTLARLLGLPVPDDHGMYPALEDLWHNLIVGPCSPEQTAGWRERAWVVVIFLSEPGYDCDYSTWLTKFSPALPPAPFQLAPYAPGESHELPCDVRVESCGDRWVVRDDHDYYWCDATENAWTDKPEEEGPNALTFATEADARAAYAQATRMYTERKERRERAMASLGR